MTSFKGSVPAAIAVLVLACGGKAVIDENVQAWGGFGGDIAFPGVSSSSSGGAGGGGSLPGGAPPIPPLVETDLGDVPTNMTIDYQVGENTLGFITLAEANNPNASVGMKQMAAPNAALLVQGYGIEGTLQDYQRPGWSAAGVPNTDHAEAMPPMNGTWQFTLGGALNLNQAHLSVWHRQTLDGAFHGGVIDLNFFIAPGTVSESYLAQLADTTFDGWAGLKVGTLRYFDLASQFSVITESNAGAALLETSDAPGKPVVNVIVVQLIDTQSMPLGFSTGLPGNPLESGTFQSAVFMALSGNTYLDRVILRHETGHFAGLFHTSEQVAGYGDHLDDTPLCADVLAMTFNCPDIQNLMFPFADPSNPLDMSAKQERVVQGSALYRGAVEAGGGYAEPLDGSGSMSAQSGPAPWKLAQAATRRSAAQTASIARNALEPARLARAHGVPEAAVRLLGSLWCGNGPQPDVREVLAAIGATDGDGLVALGSDASAPEHLRARALSLAGRLPLSSSAAHALERLASDAHASAMLRRGAQRGLDARP